MRTEQITSDDINRAAADYSYCYRLFESLGYKMAYCGNGFAFAQNAKTSITIQGAKSKYHAIKRLVRILCAGRTTDDLPLSEPLYTARPVLCDCVASKELRSLLSAHYVDRLFNISIADPPSVDVAVDEDTTRG